MKLSIERSGVFHVQSFVDGSARCGDALQNGVRFSWRATLSGDETCLNPRGWLIDNLELANYFQTRFTHVDVFPSCEEMAQTACRDLRGICARDGAKPRTVRVSISGIPDSWITAEDDGAPTTAPAP